MFDRESAWNIYFWLPYLNKLKRGKFLFEVVKPIYMNNSMWKLLLIFTCSFQVIKI